MRVLFLTADYPPLTWSGIGVAVAHQAQALAALGVEAHVFCSRRSAWEAPALPNVSLHYLHRQAFPLEPMQGDVVYLHSISLAELALELKTRWRLPLFYMAHSLFHKELIASTELHWIPVQHALFRRADHVFFLCEEERRAGISVFRGLEGRSSVFRHGITASVVRSWSRSESGPVVFAGRFCFLKGIDIFISTAVELLKRDPRRQFVMAGGHGDREETAAVHELAREFPKNCHAPGWLSRESLDNLFFKASLVLVPSRYEPFGMVALEALRMGAPVLGTATGGLAEILTRESGGKSIASYDPMRWASEAELMLSNENNTGELREQRARYIAVNYNLSQAAKNFLICVKPQYV